MNPTNAYEVNLSNRSWVFSGYRPSLVGMRFNPGEGKMCVVSVRPGHKAIKEPQDFLGGILSNKHKSNSTQNQNMLFLPRKLYIKKNTE